MVAAATRRAGSFATLRQPASSKGRQPAKPDEGAASIDLMQDSVWLRLAEGKRQYRCGTRKVESEYQSVAVGDKGVLEADMQAKR
jgi:hypothetical protein